MYFPSVFNSSDVKEYYDLLRRRTLSILEGIARGEDVNVDGLTAELVCYSRPQSFAGSESAEIVFDRNFETICLTLSEQLHIQPKGLTVLEFYNAYAFLLERARKGQKRA